MTLPKQINDLSEVGELLKLLYTTSDVRDKSHELTCEYGYSIFDKALWQ